MPSWLFVTFVLSGAQNKCHAPFLIYQLLKKYSQYEVFIYTTGVLLAKVLALDPGYILVAIYSYFTEFSLFILCTQRLKKITFLITSETEI